MDSDGSNVQVLSVYSQFTYAPEWSPDGRAIAFSQNGQITIVRSDGSHATTVGPFGAGIGVSWSPDARRLAFSQAPSGTEQVFVMDADGSHITQLTTFPTAYSAFPQWSPDGTKILFLSPRVTASDIYVMNADGSDTTRVSNIPGSQSNADATWSPDGSQIAFQALVNGGRDDIYVMDANGANPVNLTPTNVWDLYGPNWRP
jgi:TolB protein